MLLSIAADPHIRLREIGAQVGITERAAHRIVGELEAEGYLTRRREGRRNRYTIEPQLPLPDPLARDQQVADLLAILGPNGDGTATDGRARRADGRAGRANGRVGKADGRAANGRGARRTGSTGAKR